MANDRHAGVLWQSQAVLSAGALDPALAALLTASGSLTARLQAGAGASFSVQVLRQADCSLRRYPDHPLPDSAGSHGLLREVYLHCNGQAAVFAQTLIPDSTLARHSWLGELGEQPLGQKLFSRSDVMRQPFEFARLNHQVQLARSALAGLADSPPKADPLWARRSLFLVAGDPVSVNEVFFPAAIVCTA